MRYEQEQLKKYLSIGQVCFHTTLGKSCIYDKIRRGEFPKPRQLSAGRVGWLRSEIDAWSESRPVVEPEDAE